MGDMERCKIQSARHLRCRALRHGIRIGEIPIKRLAVVAVLVLFLVGAGFALYKYQTWRGETRFSHQVSYSLTVQRTRDGKSYEAAFPSHGDELFQSGDKFRLRVFKADSGFLYVFREGPPEPGDTSFRLLCPNPGTNNGSATIGKDQSLESDWITFQGTENFWIVWSATSLADLEAVKTSFDRKRASLDPLWPNFLFPLADPLLPSPMTTPALLRGVK